MKKDLPEKGLPEEDLPEEDLPKEKVTFECYHCHHKNPLIFSQFEKERTEGKIKGDSKEGIHVSRECGKCGRKNIIPIGKNPITIYLGHEF